MAKPRTSKAREIATRKRPATTLRSTSGAGFDFEDQISAWLQVKMLVGEPAPAVGGRITKIQAQVSALGWQIEDLLVTAAHDDGTEARLAISAKGNQQVSASGLPAGFIELAWKQWRDAAGPMVRGKDGLALGQAGRSSGLRSELAGSEERLFRQRHGGRGGPDAARPQAVSDLRQCT